jgi:hypothetical protein
MTHLRTHLTLTTLAAVLTLGACASATPTRELSSGYAVFDIQAGPQIGPARIAEAVKLALQKNMSQVQLSNGIPPSPLPEKAPRFALVSPFKGSGLAALAASQGQSLQVPTCEGAILTANARDSSMARYGEGTTFFACVMPYQGGYSLNVYTTFAKASGGFSAATLGATLARTVVGDSSQFIPRTIAAVVDGVKATGAEVKLIEAYQ